jgi:hypothetical protein
VDHVPFGILALEGPAPNKSLRSLSRCLTDELDIPISFKHLQRITKDLGVRCKRPKLELLHGEDYEEGKERVENYKQIASALKKRVSCHVVNILHFI